VQAAKLKEAGAQLVAMLTRPEAAVVEAVAGALKEVGEGDIDVLLLELLEHSQMHTRIAAAQLLAFVDDLTVKTTMRSRPWQLVESPYVPRLTDCLESGNDELATAANNALTSLSRLTHFKVGRDPKVSDWKQWFEKLNIERAKIAEIEAIWQAAMLCYEARKADEYRGHIAKMMDAVSMYEELKELGATTKYEHGEFGIKNLNIQMATMRKTASGF
jgi:hypothetical protein